MNDARSAAYCAYCGLPLTAARPATASPDAVDYCCSGCRVASAIADAPAADGAARRHLIRIGLAIFFTMNVVVFTMELWSQDVYSHPSYESAFAVTLRGVFQWASLLFAAPVIFLLSGPLVASVGQALRQRAATTDLLILLGVAASYLYSAISVVRGAGQIYFEVGCVVLVFVSLGRWLEARGKHHTGAALDALARLLPETVRRALASGAAVDSHSETETIPREQVQVDDVVRVLPGERIPVDGRIAAGRATLDEQIATGESRPAVKGVGDAVYSGALNLDGDLWVTVTAAAGEDLVSRMLRLVREARRRKGRYERLADRIATWFTPLVCAVALAAGLWHGWHFGADRGILVGLAVVLIACPCALGLATPMAVWTALGRAADAQVLFRSGAVLERLARVDAVCFDKTGTLTSGAPAVRRVIAADADREQVLRTATALARGSAHSLSQAIVRYAVAFPSTLSATARSGVATGDTVKLCAGRGVEACDADGRPYAHLGSPRWMTELGHAMSAELTDALAASDATEAPLTCVAWDHAVRGVFVFSEQLRPEAAEAIELCRQMDLRVCVVTGDRRARAMALARELGIDALADQLPEDKVAALARLGGRVAMVGDGLNDAPALASAEVGVSLGCGADLSRDAAGVCLLGDRLDRLPWAIALARKTLRVIRQNLFWAFAYNIAGVFLAAAGRLNPIWAAAAMGISSVIVIGNSLRLARFDLASPTSATPAAEDDDARPASAPAAAHLDPAPVAAESALEEAVA